MRRLAPAALLSALLCLALPQAASAVGEVDLYGIESASVSLSDNHAGGHPDFTVDLKLTNDNGQAYAKTKDVVVRLPAGLFGNPQAFPVCTTGQFGLNPKESACPQDSQVGSTDVTISGTSAGTFENDPIYNMPAPGGDVLARFGFYAGIYPIFLNARLDPETDTVVASVENAPSAAELVEAQTTFWGVPASPQHDPERVTPWEVSTGTQPPGGRPSNLPEVPFMTNPTSCTSERVVSITLTSYQLPGASFTKVAPFPQLLGCGALEFNPTTALAPTTAQGTTGSGLSYDLELPDKGLRFPNLYYGSEMKRAEVVLPEGMTINPSEAEGLGVCSQADLAREAYNSPPGAGCPDSSKIGTLEAISPAIDRKASGSLYLAKPYENPFDSLLALYMVLKIPDRGVLVKLAGEVNTNPLTGQITTVFDDIPELPVSEFHLHFREGARAPLVTPPACGTYTALSNLTPWSTPASVLGVENSFAISSGPDHGPCPGGGLPPFRPGLQAGTLNNAAGSYSPFHVELSRTDSEQEITHFSIKLPPGLVGKLAGIPFCSEEAIAAAAARTGPHGGEEELASPSCPAASQIGTSWAGAGVGGVLAYAPGSVYLAGPYHGAPLSVVAVTAAKVGPFDLGTVVVREGLKIDPITAEVSVDAAGSDPIPHIIAGIPVHLREIRVYVDRPGFTLNPTSCKPTATASTVLGSGLDFASEADDNPVTVSTRFQAADCASLRFQPRLSLHLKGKTKRGGNPSLRAIMEPRAGNANASRISVALPHSEFLDQGHIRTICTRVQFNAGAGNGAQCPAGSVYGHARAFTPLFSEPLEGPVFLRSSEHPLPDLVLALHGLVDIDAVGRIDSVHGGIRNTFDFIPDAPITKVVVDFQGGRKGLLENSTDICRGRHLATVESTGHNGRKYSFRTPLRPKCGKGRKP
jgi:hypothetical protein